MKRQILMAAAACALSAGSLSFAGELENLSSGAQGSLGTAFSAAINMPEAKYFKCPEISVLYQKRLDLQDQIRQKQTQIAQQAVERKRHVDTLRFEADRAAERFMVDKQVPGGLKTIRYTVAYVKQKKDFETRRSQFRGHVTTAVQFGLLPASDDELVKILTDETKGSLEVVGYWSDELKPDTWSYALEDTTWWVENAPEIKEQLYYSRSDLDQNLQAKIIEVSRSIEKAKLEIFGLVDSVKGIQKEINARSTACR